MSRISSTSPASTTFSPRIRKMPRGMSLNIFSQNRFFFFFYFPLIGRMNAEFHIFSRFHNSSLNTSLDLLNYVN
jgi:hypothetical protein